MKKIISIVLIISLLCSNAYAIVINDEAQRKENNAQFATKEEVYRWAQEMQDWFDINADLELIKKVASVSEMHGYISDKFDWNPDDYIKRR